MSSSPFGGGQASTGFGVGQASTGFGGGQAFNGFGGGQPLNQPPAFGSHLLGMGQQSTSSFGANA